MISFARAPGAAHTGNFAAAETEIGKLQALRDKLNEAKNTYWGSQIEVELARQAADLDAGMDKHPATPAPVLPARELLADLLLEARDPAALQTYEESLNRFRSILGKARTAKAAGDLEPSRETYKRLVTLSALADSERPAPAEAKTFVSN